MNQLTEESLVILKNYSNISKSLNVPKGKHVKTMSPSKAIISEVVLKDKLPCSGAIADLPKFINSLSLFDNPKIKDDEHYIYIVDENNKSQRVSYRLTSEHNILLPPDKDIELVGHSVTFKISDEDLSQLIKAARIMGLKSLRVKSKDGVLYVAVVNSKDPSQSNFTVKLDAETEKDCSFTFHLDNIKVLPYDYTVTIDERGVSKFEATDEDLPYDLLTYYIATEEFAKTK